MNLPVNIFLMMASLLEDKEEETAEKMRSPLFNSIGSICSIRVLLFFSRPIPIIKTVRKIDRVELDRVSLIE